VPQRIFVVCINKSLCTILKTNVSTAPVLPQDTEFFGSHFRLKTSMPGLPPLELVNGASVLSPVSPAFPLGRPVRAAARSNADVFIERFLPLPRPASGQPNRRGSGC
jgi:hypothetical protein